MTITQSWRKSPPLRVRRRRYLTLIEMLVSIALVSILMTLLFTSYGSVTAANREIEKVRDRAFAARYLQSRLSDILLKAGATTHKEQPFLLLSEESSLAVGDSLVFTYDNGYSCEPRYAGYVLGRLYRTPEEELCLATWPYNEPEMMRKEVIARGVTEMQFQFLDDQGERRSDLEEIDLPQLTWVTLTVDGRQIELAYPHPAAIKSIEVEGI